MLNKPLQRQLKEEGYIILPEVLIGEQLDRLRTACDYVLEQYTDENDRNHPGKDFGRMIHLNDPKWHQSNREHLLVLLEMIADPRFLGPVEQIFSKPSLFYTTQYFVNLRYGSHDGDWHRDCQFLTANEEEEKAYLKKRWAGGVEGIQIQIALADNDDVEFVPYSVNRYDSPEEYHIRLADNNIHSKDNNMPNALRISLKAGDVLMFDPAGLHRGRYHKENFRRTFMVTYTFDPFKSDFSHQPYFLEPGYLEGLSPRAQAYFGEFIKAYKHIWDK